MSSSRSSRSSSPSSSEEYLSPSQIPIPPSPNYSRARSISPRRRPPTLLSRRGRSLETIRMRSPKVIQFENPFDAELFKVLNKRPIQFDKALDLIRQGANPNLFSKANKTALYLAVENNDLANVEELLKIPNIDVDKGNNQVNYSPLELAAELGYTPIVKVLLENGADPNASTKYTTTLTTAVSEGFIEIVKLLLESPRIDINNNIDGYSALYIASMYNKPDIVKLLLKNKNLNPNIQNDKGDTPLIIAVKERHIPIVKLLVDDPRVDSNIKNKDDETAFDYADATIKQIIVKTINSKLLKPKYRKLISDIQKEIKKLYKNPETSLLAYHLQRLLTLYNETFIENPKKWDRVLTESLPLITQPTLNNQRKFYGLIRDILAIDLDKPCENYDLDFIYQTSFEDYLPTDYFIIILPTGKRYCISNDAVSYMESNMAHNWVRNNPLKEIEPQGYGGHPGDENYYKIPIDISAWISQQGLEVIKQNIGRPLPIYYLTDEEPKRLGVEFGISRLHGQLPPETTFNIGRVEFGKVSNLSLSRRRSSRSPKSRKTVSRRRSLSPRKPNKK